MKNVSRIMSFRARRGWSVVEVLIGVAFLAAVVMISMPGIDRLARDHHLRKTSSNLFASLVLAQKEATRRGSRAQLCPSSDGKSCRPDGDWNRGWIIFVDINANHEPEQAEVVEIYGPPKGKVHIDASGSFSPAVEFWPGGQLVEDDRPAAGSFRVCYGDDLSGYREILMDEGGRPDARESKEECFSS